MTASFSLPFWRRWKTQRPGGGGGARSALKSRGEALPPAPAFLFGRPGGPWAPGPPNAAAPPGRCGFLPAKRSIRHPFPTSASYKQNEPAAPHERRAGIFRRKTEEVFQLVFPRFFQKRKGGGAERRQWRKKRGGSPVSKGVEGSRFSGDAQRPLRTAGAERRQWRKKRGGSPVSKGVEGCRLGGDAQRPLRTAGAERRQWRKKRGGSPVSKGVEGSRFSGDAQRPLRTVWGQSPQRGPGAEPLAGSGASPRRKPRKLPPVTPAQAGTGPGGGGRGSPPGDRRRCPGF